MNEVRINDARVDHYDFASPGRILGGEPGVSAVISGGDTFSIDVCTIVVTTIPAAAAHLCFMRLSGVRQSNQWPHAGQSLK